MNMVTTYTNEKKTKKNTTPLYEGHVVSLRCVEDAAVQSNWKQQH